MPKETYLSTVATPKSDPSRAVGGTYSKRTAPSTLSETIETDEPLDPEAAKERMIFYDGFVKLRSVKPQETIDAVTDLAKAVGGYVESLKSNMIVLRIPVAKFDEIYKTVLKLADVLEKSVSARDITEAFQDVELRLATAIMTRNRLVELLSQSKDEKEKIRLLKEIQRLSEQVETLENLKTMLSTMADFSKLTIVVEERQLMAGRADAEELAEFKWILSLSPFKRDTLKEAPRLNFTVPKEMVALDRKGHFIAESADGTVFWATSRDNLPQGNTQFWIEAMKVRLAPEFGTVSQQKAGDYVLLRFVENAEKPYIYLIGVKADNAGEVREPHPLHLIQVYFPSEAQEKRYGESILDSIAKGVQ